MKKQNGAATKDQRALVTANIKDFVPLDRLYRATGRAHAGLVLVSVKTFPQNRSFVGALVNSLDELLDDATLRANATVFLVR